MPASLPRRTFLGASAAFAAAAVSAHAQPRAAAPGRGEWRKAVKLGMVQEGASFTEKFALLKELGFDGVELDSPNGFATKDVLAARDATGLPIHGVVDSTHWSKPFSHPDAAIRDAAVADLRTALHDAHDYGASTVLVVPAVVHKGVRYDHAWERSLAAIRRAVPLAEELGVKIAFENVWNSFLLSPLEFAHYVDAFESDHVGAYFDVGNIVNFGWPEHWVRILGPRILKIDVKEYSRKRRDDEGLWKGFDVALHEGDCDWPAVAQALRDIGYSGWFTAEITGGKRDRLHTIAERMDRIFAA